MSSSILKMNRGDFFSFVMSIDDETSITGSYRLQSNDILYFALLAPHARFEDALLLRGYTAEDATEVTTDNGSIQVFNIELSRADTLYLDPGVYYYTFKLQKNAKSVEASSLDDADAELITVVERTKFIIND